jgi:hypothetical protein
MRRLLVLHEVVRVVITVFYEFGTASLSNILSRILVTIDGV